MPLIKFIKFIKFIKYIKKKIYFLFSFLFSVSLIYIFIPISIANSAVAAEFIGYFSNVRYTAEHAYGAEVQLWKDKKGIFGFFLVSNGLAGDTPTGKLERVSYDATSGHLKFSAKLSTAAASHDLFSFDGYLKKALLLGEISAREMHQPKVVEKKKISLRKTPETGEHIQSRKDYDDFFQIIKPTRGPQW